MNRRLDTELTISLVYDVIEQVARSEKGIFKVRIKSNKIAISIFSIITIITIVITFVLLNNLVVVHSQPKPPRLTLPTSTPIASRLSTPAPITPTPTTPTPTPPAPTPLGPITLIPTTPGPITLVPKNPTATTPVPTTPVPTTPVPTTPVPTTPVPTTPVPTTPAPTTPAPTTPVPTTPVPATPAPTPTPTPTPVVVPNPYPPSTGTLVMDDPLIDNSKGYQWDNTTVGSASCGFSGGAYHVGVTAPGAITCFPEAPGLSLSNLTYEINLKVIKGEIAGITFRFNQTNTTGYVFFIDALLGTYILATANGTSAPFTPILTGQSPAIKTGLNQSNVLAVVAQGSTINLYVNNQLIATANDSTYSQGQIGLFVVDSQDPADIEVSNARAWTL